MATRTVVFISRLKSGSEQEIANDLPKDFPSEALSEIGGIKRVKICQGSGLFASIGENEGDFEKIFQDYISSPSIQAFHSKIGRFFESPPQPVHPADVTRLRIGFGW